MERYFGKTISRIEWVEPSCFMDIYFTDGSNVEIHAYIGYEPGSYSNEDTPLIEVTHRAQRHSKPSDVS